MSLVGNLGDNAKTSSIIETNEASNQWGWYQAKAVKGQMATIHGELLGALSGAAPDEARAKEIARLRDDATRYEQEKAGIKKQAEDLQKQAAHDSKTNDRCDLASLMLQIAVVICSVAILSHWRAIWCRPRPRPGRGHRGRHGVSPLSALAGGGSKNSAHAGRGRFFLGPASGGA